jgi:hypothetical protein
MVTVPVREIVSAPRRLTTLISAFASNVSVPAGGRPPAVALGGNRPPTRSNATSPGMRNGKRNRG